MSIVNIESSGAGLITSVTLTATEPESRTGLTSLKIAERSSKDDPWSVPSESYYRVHSRSVDVRNVIIHCGTATTITQAP